MAGAKTAPIGKVARRSDAAGGFIGGTQGDGDVFRPGQSLGRKTLCYTWYFGGPEIRISVCWRVLQPPRLPFRGAAAWDRQTRCCTQFARATPSTYREFLQPQCRRKFMV